MASLATAGCAYGLTTQGHSIGHLGFGVKMRHFATGCKEMHIRGRWPEQKGAILLQFVAAVFKTLMT